MEVKILKQWNIIVLIAIGIDMIVIGSIALNFHIPLKRKIHDIDLLGTQEEFDDFYKTWGNCLVKNTKYSYIFDIEGAIVEFRNPSDLDETDLVLLGEYYKKPYQYIDTIYGKLIVPELEVLYDIKKATIAFINEPKHLYDFDLIKDAIGIQKDTSFYKQRLEETRQRSEQSGKKLYDFFHKYHIPEYILHDRLHEIFVDLLDITIPTYKRITTAETDIAEELFNKLTHEQKVSLMVEESLVLNLERWFVPQMVENGINYKLIDHFYNNNEAMPTYKILKHVNLTGLKGEAKYITDFGKANFFEIEKSWIAAKEKIKAKGGFPGWFFQELFNLREKYKKGEKIGFHQTGNVV